MSGVSRRMISPPLMGRREIIARPFPGSSVGPIGGVLSMVGFFSGWWLWVGAARVLEGVFVE